MHKLNAQVEGALAAEVNSIVLDTLEHLVQVFYFVFLVSDLFVFWTFEDILKFLWRRASAQNLGFNSLEQLIHLYSLLQVDS